MLKRRTSGSVICPSCGSLVGVNDDRCYSCGRAQPALWGFAPVLRQLGADLGFVPLVIGTCTVMYLLTLVTSSGGVMSGSGLNFLSPGDSAIFALGMSGAGPVIGGGRWWSVLTATWLHGGLLHIVFNMMSVRNLIPPTIELIGPGRTMTIYVLSGVAGFALTSIVWMYFPYVPFFHGARSTVGASAAICGLLGAITHYGRKSGSSLIRAQTQQWAISMVIYSLLPGIDSVAHAGGFLGGYGLSAFFNPLTKERGDHMLVAIICLGITALALAYTVARGFSLL
jgi:rhomboid protease GluP